MNRLAFFLIILSGEGLGKDWFLITQTESIQQTVQVAWELSEEKKQAALADYLETTGKVVARRVAVRSPSYYHFPREPFLIIPVVESFQFQPPKWTFKFVNILGGNSASYDEANITGSFKYSYIHDVAPNYLPSYKVVSLGLEISSSGALPYYLSLPDELVDQLLTSLAQKNTDEELSRHTFSAARILEDEGIREFLKQTKAELPASFTLLVKTQIVQPQHNGPYQFTPHYKEARFILGSLESLEKKPLPLAVQSEELASKPRRGPLCWIGSFFSHFSKNQ